MTQHRLYPSAALHGQVAHEMGRQIVSGVIGEGKLLPREAELSDRYQVSRQAVREALKVLAAKGLVKTRRRTGNVVAPRSECNLLDPDVLAWHAPGGITPGFLDELVELRFLIEPSAAELAAIRADPERIARIRAAFEAMRSSDGNPTAFYAADVAFHSAIFSASGNSLIDRMSTIIAPLLQAAFGLHGTVGPFSKSVELHEAVYRSIARGDAEGAKAAMQTVLAVSSDEIEHLKRQARGGNR